MPAHKKAAFNILLSPDEKNKTKKGVTLIINIKI
jgi:hypothetical protein